MAFRAHGNLSQWHIIIFFSSKILAFGKDGKSGCSLLFGVGGCWTGGQTTQRTDRHRRVLLFFFGDSCRGRSARSSSSTFVFLMGTTILQSFSFTKGSNMVEFFSFFLFFSFSFFSRKLTHKNTKKTRNTHKTITKKVGKFLSIHMKTLRPLWNPLSLVTNRKRWIDHETGDAFCGLWSVESGSGGAFLVYFRQ